MGPTFKMLPHVPPVRPVHPFGGGQGKGPRHRDQQWPSRHAWPHGFRLRGFDPRIRARAGGAHQALLRRGDGAFRVQRVRARRCPECAQRLLDKAAVGRRPWDWRHSPFSGCQKCIAKIDTPKYVFPKKKKKKPPPKNFFSQKKKKKKKKS